MVKPLTKMKEKASASWRPAPHEIWSGLTAWDTCKDRWVERMRERGGERNI